MLISMNWPEVCGVVSPQVLSAAGARAKANLQKRISSLGWVVAVVKLAHEEVRFALFALPPQAAMISLVIQSCKVT